MSDSKHIGLGAITNKVGLTKGNIMDGLKLGLGAAAFPFAYSAIRGQVLLRISPQFSQGTMVEKATRAIAGVILGTVAGRMAGAKWRSVGDGMAAAAIGSVIMDVAAPLLNPAAGAAQAAVTAAEMTTGQEQMSGIAPLAKGLAGLGAARGGNASLLYGVGTPDMSGANMFGGATVAVEDTSGPMSGATVAIETPNFASSLF